MHNYIFQGSIYRWSSQGLSDHTSRQGTGLTERKKEPHELEYRVGVRNVRTSAAKLPPELEPIRANSQKIPGPIAELEHSPIGIRRKPLAGTQTSKRKGDSVSPLLAELGTGCRSPAASLGSDRHSNHAMSRPPQTPTTTSRSQSVHSGSAPLPSTSSGRTILRRTLRKPGEDMRNNARSTSVVRATEHLFVASFVPAT